MVYSEPNMNEHGPGMGIHVVLNNMFHCGRGYMNFYNQIKRTSQKSTHLPNALVGASGRRVTAKWGKSLF
jgi:hypothetical protein